MHICTHAHTHTCICASQPSLRASGRGVHICMHTCTHAHRSLLSRRAAVVCGAPSPGPTRARTRGLSRGLTLPLALTLAGFLITRCRRSRPTLLASTRASPHTAEATRIVWPTCSTSSLSCLTRGHARRPAVATRPRTHIYTCSCAHAHIYEHDVQPVLSDAWTRTAAGRANQTAYAHIYTCSCAPHMHPAAGRVIRRRPRHPKTRTRNGASVPQTFLDFAASACMHMRMYAEARASLRPSHRGGGAPL